MFMYENRKLAMACNGNHFHGLFNTRQFAADGNLFRLRKRQIVGFDSRGWRIYPLQRLLAFAEDGRFRLGYLVLMKYCSKGQFF